MDGSKNEFVDFYNGDVKGEDTETLNHFDAHTRYRFESIFPPPFSDYRMIQ